MGDKLIEIQNQIRNNATSIRDYMDELASWEEEINQIDAQLANKTFPLLDPPPVRSQAEVAPKTEPKKYQRDKNNMKDYYKAWDNYDVDNELEKLEDQSQILKPPKKPAKPKSQIVVKGGRTVNSDVDRLKDAGNLEFSKKNYAAATEKYLACLDLDVPSDTQVVLFSNLSECWLRLREHEKALQAAESALKIDSKHVKSLLRSGKAKRALNMFKSGRADLETAVSLDSNNGVLKQELDKLNKKAKSIVDEIKEKMVIKGKVSVNGLRSIEISEISEKADIKKEEKNIKAQTEKAIDSISLEKLPAPKNLVELERTWTMLTDIKKLKSYLESIPDPVVASLFEKGNLESDFLMRIINTLLSQFVELQGVALKYVEAIVSNKKFSVLAKFLTKKEKEKIKELLKLLGNPFSNLDSII